MRYLLLFKIFSITLFLFNTETNFAQNCPRRVSLYSQEQIDSFKIKYPNCIQLKANIFIKAPDATNLNGLSNLEGLEGGLTVKRCDSLENFVGLEKLKSVSFIDVNYNKSLKSFKGLEGLEEIYSPYISRLYISYCPKLKSLSGLENLKKLNSIEIDGCSQLSSIESLENVREIKSIRIRTCDSFVKFPKLTHDYLYNLTVYECNRLKNLNGLESIKKVNYINLMNLDSLENCRGLDQLEEVERMINIDKTSINSLAGLSSLKYVASSLIISSNSNLKDISSLSNLQTIGGGLVFSYNPKIKDLSPLKNLISIKELTIIANKNLKNLGRINKDMVESDFFRIERNHPSLKIPEK